VFSVAAAFAPEMQNSGSTADAVGLFLGSETSVPVDAVVYGGANNDRFLSPSGTPFAAPHVGDVVAGHSIERVGDTWIDQASPNPGVCTVGAD